MAKLGLRAGAPDDGEQANGFQGVGGGLASAESAGEGRRGSGDARMNWGSLGAERAASEGKGSGDVGA